MKKPAGPIRMQKRNAMGGEVQTYAGGGSVGHPERRVIGIGVGVGTGQVNAVKNPLIAARRNNGVKGMKGGGSTGGSCW
jgi:hypothetical protein